MSEDNIVEAGDRIILGALNEIDKSKPIGGENTVYYLRFERVSDSKCLLGLETQEGNLVGGMEEVKIIDLSVRLKTNRSPTFEDIESVLGEIDASRSKRIRRIIGVVQKKWLRSDFDAPQEPKDTAINEEEYSKYKDEVLQEAERILSSKDPIVEISKHLDNIIAGEEENKQLLFTLALSGKSRDLTKKTIICALHQAGAGKTWLLKNIASLYNSHTVSHVSNKALNYLGDQLSGRIDDEGNIVPDELRKPKEILFLKELGNIDKENDTSGNASIKMLSVDDGGLTTTYTVRDDETGRFRTVTVHTDPITVMTSSTRTMGDIDPQFVRRYWVLSPDASAAQTRKIAEFKTIHHNQLNDVRLGFRSYTDMEFSQWVLKCLVEMLEWKSILLPFSREVFEILDKSNIRIRSDFDKILLMIEMFGLLNQRNLPMVTLNGETHYIITPGRVVQILRIAKDTLVFMANETEGRVYDLIEVLKDMELSNGDESGQGATIIDVPMQWKIAERMGGVARGRVLEYFKPLVSLGHIAEEMVGKTKVFRLNTPINRMVEKLTGYKNLNDVDLLKKLYYSLIEEGNDYFELNGVDFRFEANENEIEGLFEVKETVKHFS